MTSGCELLGFSKLCRVKPEMRPFKGKCRCCRKWCSWVSVCLFLSTLIPCEAGCSNFSALLQLMNWKWILKCMPAEWKSKFFGHSRTVTFLYLIFCKFSPCSIYSSFFFFTDDAKHLVPNKMRDFFCTINLDQEEVFRTQVVEKSLR